jgi:hypothetical protein
MAGDGAERALRAARERWRLGRAVTALPVAVALAYLLPYQALRLQLDIGDYRTLGEAHLRLVRMYREVAGQLPVDRPLLVANRGTRRPLEELADSVRGYPKQFFVRPAALWELVDFAPLANYAGHPFVRRMRPLPRGRLAAVMEGDFCPVIFTDRGFQAAEGARASLRAYFREQGRLPPRVEAFEVERVGADRD